MRLVSGFIAAPGIQPSGSQRSWFPVPRGAGFIEALWVQADGTTSRCCFRLHQGPASLRLVTQQPPDGGDLRFRLREEPASFRLGRCGAVSVFGLSLIRIRDAQRQDLTHGTAPAATTKLCQCFASEGVTGQHRTALDGSIQPRKPSTKDLSGTRRDQPGRGSSG